MESNNDLCHLAVFVRHVADMLLHYMIQHLSGIIGNQIYHAPQIHPELFEMGDISGLYVQHREDCPDNYVLSFVDLLRQALFIPQN